MAGIVTVAGRAEPAGGLGSSAARCSTPGKAARRSPVERRLAQAPAVACG
jgi:hypothetical protein